jgi:hypothetical protein
MHGGDPNPAAIAAARSRWPRLNLAKIAPPGAFGLPAEPDSGVCRRATAPAGRAGLILGALPVGPCREGPGLREPARVGTSSDTPGQASRPRALRALCLQRHRACNLTHNGPGGPVFTSSWRIPRISPPRSTLRADAHRWYWGEPSRALLQRRPGLVQVGLSVFMPFAY